MYQSYFEKSRYYSDIWVPSLTQSSSVPSKPPFPSSKKREREYENDDERESKNQENEKEKEKEKVENGFNIDDEIIIKVQTNTRSSDGSSICKFIHFRVNKKVKLNKLEDATKEKININHLKFSFNGKPYTTNDSILSLNIKDGDIILAEQTIQ